MSAPIGRELAKLRRKGGITVRGLAAIVGCSYHLIWQIESRYQGCSPELLDKIIVALDAQPEAENLRYLRAISKKSARVSLDGLSEENREFVILIAKSLQEKKLSERQIRRLKGILFAAAASPAGN